MNQKRLLRTIDHHSSIVFLRRIIRILEHLRDIDADFVIVIVIVRVILKRVHACAEKSIHAEEVSAPDTLTFLLAKATRKTTRNGGDKRRNEQERKWKESNEKYVKKERKKLHDDESAANARNNFSEKRRACLMEERRLKIFQSKRRDARVEYAMVRVRNISYCAVFVESETCN